MRISPAVILLLALAACGPTAPEGDPAAGEARVVVYTSRQPHLVEGLFRRFTAATGIVVDYSSDNEAALIERLAAEGGRTPADVFLTVDAGNLWFAAQRGILQPAESAYLEERIPDSLRDPDGRWYGLSLRARTIVHHHARVRPEELSSYEDLAAPRWSGRLCLRTSRKVYNQSLVAILIEHHGEERAEEIVRGWVANLATHPFASDTQVIEAIAAGQCDVGIVNSYYLARLQAENRDYPVDLFWANQGSTGVHVNISGAGITTHAPRKERAREFLEWLAGPEAQAAFAAANLEFPAVPDIELEPVILAWGSFTADSTSLVVAGQRQVQAVRLMDRAGWR